MADNEALLRELDGASKRLQDLAAVGAPHGSRCNAEQRYTLAYAACVRAGLKPRLRAKRRNVSPTSQHGGHNNNRSTMGKHIAHPHVFAFQRNNYRCEPKWNPAEKVT